MNAQEHIRSALLAARPPPEWAPCRVQITGKLVAGGPLQTWLAEAIFARSRRGRTVYRAVLAQEPTPEAAAVRVAEALRGATGDAWWRATVPCASGGVW